MKRHLAKAHSRVKSWINPRSFNPDKLRGIVLGITMTTTIGEFCAYKLIRQNVVAGELPAFTLDLIIILGAILEAVVAPFVSWWGFKRRRVIFIGYTLMVILSTMTWFFLPKANFRKESEFCSTANTLNNLSYIGITPAVAARFVVVILTGVMFIISRVAVWSHGLAYSDEYAPDRTTVHFGVAIMSRMLAMVGGDRLLSGMAETNLPLQTALLVVGFSLNLVQLFFVVPKTAPEVDGVQKTEMPFEERSFLLSMGRVFCNAVAMSQMFAMGLLAAAIWGFAYHEIDIVKAKFNLIPSDSQNSIFAWVMHYYLLIPIVAYAGTLFAAPILPQYCKLQAIKQVIKTSTFVCVFFIVMTAVPRCEPGSIAGLESGVYGHPDCSLSCGCKPRWQEFSPVCVPDTMITYLSPCQAGCSGTDVLNGVEVFTNCTCAGGGQALAGACTSAWCEPAHNVHIILFAIMILFAMLAFQAQGVLLLKTVDPRDKSVVMGIAWSTVATIAFVCGHLIFLGIRVGTCSWYESSKCHLQGREFPYLLGFGCAFLALLSTALSVISWASIRATNKMDRLQDTRL